MRPPAPIQSLFPRNLEENRKSPATGSGRAFGRGLGCEGSLGELSFECGDALIGIDGKAGLLLQDHGGYESILSMGHDEGHLHLAAAGLLRKQLGLRVVSADKCIAGILVQLLGLLKITLASSIERCKQIGLGVTRVCDDLESNHIVGISHIDTRKLVRHLRSAGVMRAAIFSGDALLDGDGKLRTIDSMLDEVKATPQMKGMSLYDEVSTKEAYTIEPCGEFEGKEPLFTVAAVDLGIKSMTPHRMAERGCRVHVVPSTITFDELQSLNPDGVFFSNGPGDPEQADPEVNLLRQVLDAGYPFFGICFGNQLLGRALGFGTYKLKFGHRGINQPVKDMTTGKIEITAHNHGFAVDAPIGETVDAPFENGKYGKVFVSHIDLNDNVVEGLQCVDIPAFSVQYHPEAAAGPHDAAYLFDRFVDLMRSV